MKAPQGGGIKSRRHPEYLDPPLPGPTMDVGLAVLHDRTPETQTAHTSGRIKVRRFMYEKFVKRF